MGLTTEYTDEYTQSAQLICWRKLFGHEITPIYTKPYDLEQKGGKPPSYLHNFSSQNGNWHQPEINDLCIQLKKLE